MAVATINTIGRRKTAVARIYMQPGTGLITINNRSIEDYFPSEILRTIVHQPLTLLEELGKYDFKVNVKGGGYTGQAEAIRLAIARALVEQNGTEVKPALRKEGWITRDARMVERKKYGRRKARRRFQFSKR